MRPDDNDSRLPAIPEWQDQQLGAPYQTFRGSAGPPHEPSYAEHLGSKTLHDYLHAFLQRKWLLVAFLLAGFIAGLATAVPKPLTYAAETTLEIQGLNESFMNLNQVDPAAAAGVYSASAANINTQIEILNSNSLRQRVVERLEREMIPTTPPAGTGLAAAFNQLRNGFGFAPESPVDAMREAIRTAGSSRRARVQEGTRIIRISCDSTIPEVGAEFLSVMVAEYTEQGLENRARSARSTNQWLDNQLQDQKNKLEEAETRLKDFVAQAGVEGLTQNEQPTTLASSRLAQLQQELAAIQAERIARQSRYEIAASKGPEALPEVMAGSLLPSQKAKLADLEQQLAVLTTTFTRTHPKVRTVLTQIDEVKKGMETESVQILERLKNDLDAARRREQLLSSSFKSETGAIQAQADVTLQYNLLRREVESNRQIYNNILQQVNQAGIATAVPTQNVRIVDTPAPSRLASLRSVYIGGGLGLMTGLLVGCVLAVMLYQGEQRFHKPGEPVSVLNVPELGVIPSNTLFESTTRLQRLANRLRFVRGREEGLLEATAKMPVGQGPRVELITHEQRPSLVAESFRAVLTSILFAPQHLQPKILTITSANPQDGKSTVTSNLAIALADMGRRVLLVDCDLRKPRQHTVFTVDNSWGLSDILLEDTPVSSYTLSALARESQIPGLSVVTSGAPLESATNHIHSARFRDLLDRFRAEFDYVLIDTPPLMLVPDARVVGQWSDGVILVIRAGQTLQADALAVARRLQEDGTRILGTILNQWIPPGLGRKNYQKYYQYYRHKDV